MDDGRLVVNDDEADRVRTIFELYLDHLSLIVTSMRLDERGWTNKRFLLDFMHIDCDCLRCLVSSMLLISGKVESE